MIANPIKWAKDEPPNSGFLEWLAQLINVCVKKFGATACNAAVATSPTSIATLVANVRGLAPTGTKNRAWAEMLANGLIYAYNKKMMDATDIAAFLTMNGGAAATTDVLWGLCTQHDSRLTATWRRPDQGGPHFEPTIPSMPIPV